MREGASRSVNETTRERMTPQRYQTLRHMETVRNYLNVCIRELLTRGSSTINRSWNRPKSRRMTPSPTGCAG